MGDHKFLVQCAQTDLNHSQAVELGKFWDSTAKADIKSSRLKPKPLEVDATKQPQSTPAGPVNPSL